MVSKGSRLRCISSELSQASSILNYLFFSFSLNALKWKIPTFFSLWKDYLAVCSLMMSFELRRIRWRVRDICLDTASYSVDHTSMTTISACLFTLVLFYQRQNLTVQEFFQALKPTSSSFYWIKIRLHHLQVSGLPDLLILILGEAKIQTFVWKVKVSKLARGWLLLTARIHTWPGGQKGTVAYF